MRGRMLLIVVVLAVLVAASSATADPSGRGPLGFKISFASSVRNAPVTGRMYVIVSRSSEDEPRFQIDVTDGVPFWGKNVSGLQPDQVVVLSSGDSEVYGYPLPSLDQLPPGNYYVQAFLNVYTRFQRSDGSVVWLHMPCGDGQNPFDSPGNLYSGVVPVHLNPAASGTVKLTLDRVIEPAQPVPPGGTCQQGNPSDTAHVKHVKIQSELLSGFWGTPIHIGANILLPEGYESDTSTRYPVVYRQGHFPRGNPFGFREDLGNSFSRWWVSPDAPRMIVVEIRHENPYYDDSYAVNSANLGPYGDAIAQELIPYIDANFRTIPERSARTLTGGSTGGWEALAQMVFYPDTYAGTWALCPDPVDFRFHQLVNVYEDPNAYFTQHEWLNVPRPSAREVSGDTIWTMEEENHWEAALGTNGRSGLGQWDIWQVVYGPQGPDGYPAPIWDKFTGEIDHSVAQGWHGMDIRLYLESNWPSLGPKLTDRVHIFTGDDDTFFLNDAVELLEAAVANLKDPPANFEFQYGHNQPHCWSPYTNPELLTIIYSAMTTGGSSALASGQAAEGAQTTVTPGSHVFRELDNRSGAMN